MRSNLKQQLALAGKCILLATLAIPAVAIPSAQAQSVAEGYDSRVPKPTLTDVRYGQHKRHTLDFWQAASDSPTPVVFVVHGGGWVSGSKERVLRFADPAALVNAGISVVAINYRLMKHSKDVTPPVKAPLEDAARALQFVRSKAKQWNIDKNRIAAAGGSAGGCSILWLAFHDDMANPKSTDPIARESTRLFCVSAKEPQTTLDPAMMKKWIPNIGYGGHAFGKKNFAQFLAERDSITDSIAKYSPYSLVSADDPPVFMFYKNAPAMGLVQKNATHSANFGIGLQKRCEELGVPCDLVFPGSPVIRHESTTDYLIDRLRVGQ